MPRETVGAGPRLPAALLALCVACGGDGGSDAGGGTGSDAAGTSGATSGQGSSEGGSDGSSDSGDTEQGTATTSSPSGTTEGTTSSGGEAGRPLLGIVVNSCGDMPPDGEGEVIAELAGLGASFYTVRAEWALLTDPGFMNLMIWAMPWYADLGYEVMLTIPTVDTIVRTMPESLAGLPMDDPAVLSAFDDILTELLTPEVIASIDYFSVGNEVDIYFETHPEEVPQFATFARAAYARARELGLTVPSCVTFTQDGYLDDVAAAASSMLPDCDFLPITYYPMEDGFQYLPPQVGVDAITALLDDGPDIPVVYQEIGYVSSEANGGSEEAQAEYFDLALAALSRPEVEAVSIDWYCDRPRVECEDMAENLYEVTPDNPQYEAFVGFLCSLGLRHEDGTPKLAYDVFLDWLAQP